MYAIVWLSLIVALTVYCIALVKAWHYRRSLVGLLNPLNENPFVNMGVTTEIEVVYTEAGSRKSIHPCEDQIALAPRSRLDAQERGEAKGPYTVSVRGQDPNGMIRSRPDLLRLPTLTRNAALAEENAEAWLYARIAFLYFLSLIICWIPASANRLLSVIRPDELNFGLNYAAIVGLPLQGFLNALVYYVSSQTAVKRLFRRKPHAQSRPHHGPPEQHKRRDSGFETVDSVTKAGFKPSTLSVASSQNASQFQFGLNQNPQTLSPAPYQLRGGSKSASTSVEELQHGNAF